MESEVQSRNLELLFSVRNIKDSIVPVVLNVSGNMRASENAGLETIREYNRHYKSFNFAKKKLSICTILKFIEAPKPKSEEVKNVNVLVGEMLELVCQIQGIPEPKIHWEIPEIASSIVMNRTTKKLVSLLCQSSKVNLQGLCRICRQSFPLQFFFILDDFKCNSAVWRRLHLHWAKRRRNWQGRFSGRYSW